MPFPQQVPRQFTKTRVESITPDQYGCYGMMKGQTVVYVGKGDIRARLLEHLEGDNPCITLQQPTHWLDLVTADMDNEEKRLIAEFSPICNQEIG